MEKQKIIVVAGIALMALASCGGEEEKSPENELQNDWSETTQQEEDQSDASLDDDEVEVSDESSASDEMDEILDDYEEYVEGYAAIIKRQKADPTDMSILTEYQELMQKGTEWSTKMSEMSSEFGPEHLTRMQEIQATLMKAAM
ncbi:MAG: hypothetical protein ACI865_000074 [Flavobacteriaceae bacterium]|jgi:hypothetical protein